MQARSLFGRGTAALETPVILNSVISVILVLAIGLAIGLAWSLLRPRNSWAGKSAGPSFLSFFWRWVSPKSSGKLEDREVLGQLSDRLTSSDATSREQDATIVDLLSKIVDANASLHARLEHAEGTLENQVAEISAYKSEARTDPMTGLANRRVFDEQLRDRLAAFQRDKVPVSILLLDIDHFRGFNNDYGHQAGDVSPKEHR